MTNEINKHLNEVARYFGKRAAQTEAELFDVDSDWAVDTDDGIEVEEYDLDDFEHVTLQASGEREPIRRHGTIQQYRDTHPSYTHGRVHVASKREIRAFERNRKRFEHTAVCKGLR